MSNLQLSYTFKWTTLTGDERDRLMKYWGKAGFRLKERMKNRYEGSRGSIFGNMFSYDMTKLIGRCTLDLSNSNSVSTTLSINTALQMITEWNKAAFLLELLLAKKTMLQQPDPEWLPEFWKQRKVAAVKSTLSAMVAGTKTDDVWVQRFQELCENDPFPVIEFS